MRQKAIVKARTGHLESEKKDAATLELGLEELTLTTKRILSNWPLSRDEKRVPQHLTLCRVDSAGPSVNISFCGENFIQIFTVTQNCKR
eukprot:g66136.t1